MLVRSGYVGRKVHGNTTGRTQDGSQTIEFTAPDPGEYTFVCTLHPGMEGTLVVETAN
jgi:plastocyanin